MQRTHGGLSATIRVFKAHTLLSCAGWRDAYTPSWSQPAGTLCAAWWRARRAWWRVRRAPMTNASCCFSLALSPPPPPPPFALQACSARRGGARAERQRRAAAGQPSSAAEGHAGPGARAAGPAGLEVHSFLAAAQKLHRSPRAPAAEGLAARPAGVMAAPCPEQSPPVLVLCCWHHPWLLPATSLPASLASCVQNAPCDLARQ